MLGLQKLYQLFRDLLTRPRKDDFNAIITQFESEHMQRLALMDPWEYRNAASQLINSLPETDRLTAAALLFQSRTVLKLASEKPNGYGDLLIGILKLMPDNGDREKFQKTHYMFPVQGADERKGTYDEGNKKYEGYVFPVGDNIRIIAGCHNITIEGLNTHWESPRVRPATRQVLRKACLDVAAAFRAANKPDEWVQMAEQSAQLIAGITAPAPRVGA